MTTQVMSRQLRVLAIVCVACGEVLRSVTDDCKCTRVPVPSA
jgi:hypothetical protein